ncbi:MAG: hypothetical protein IKK57_00665 [Clostridia bacterium]|nr:hypothetical protein [Clostridia bacterium]
MRCPKCEQWNRASLPRCQRCGAELNASAAVEPSWRAKMQARGNLKTYVRVDEDGQVDVSPDRRDALAQEMTELKIRIDDGAQRVQQLMTETASMPPVSPDPAVPFFSEDDSPAEAAASSTADAPEEDIPAAAPVNPFTQSEGTRRTARVAIHGLTDTASVPNAAASRPASAPAASSPAWSQSRSYDPLAEEAQREQQAMFRNAPPTPRRQNRRTHSRRANRRRIINLLTTALVVVVLALTGAVAFSAWQQYRASHAEDNTVIVTASMKDDQAAHTILIPGEDGQRIYIRELHATYEVVGGFATIVIPDHTWYENLDVVTEETLTVTLTPALQTSGARQKAMEPITYEISIPISPIELVSPEYVRTEVTAAMYTLQFKVRPGSTVLVNGVDMSDTVDDTGLMVYNATVQPIGDNVYTVNVRSPYCRDNSMEVILFRQVQEIPLDLAVTTYTSTSLDKYQITCTTLPGADVQILTPHSDLVITDLNTTGEFSFYALFEKIGYNTVSIQATYPGKKTSRVDYTIYYLPNVDVYTRKAWSLANPADYAELTGNISFRAEKSQIYLASGSFDSFISEAPQLAIMYCGVDGVSQPVLLQNETKTTWHTGDDYEYRIYCDVYGSYNGMPWLIARYTYVDKEPARN